MNEIDYSIDALVDTFKEHAEAFRVSKQELVEDYESDFTDDELPAFLQDDFNLPFALSKICEEIISLKNNCL